MLYHSPHAEISFIFDARLISVNNIYGYILLSLRALFQQIRTAQIYLLDKILWHYEILPKQQICRRFLFSFTNFTYSEKVHTYKNVKISINNKSKFRPLQITYSTISHLATYKAIANIDIDITYYWCHAVHASSCPVNAHWPKAHFLMQNVTSTLFKFTNAARALGSSWMHTWRMLNIIFRCQI